MTQRAANHLTFGRKLLLAAAGLVALAGPIVFGLMNAPQSRAQSPAAESTPRLTFDVASIKPYHGEGNFFKIRAERGMFAAEGVTVKFLVQFAYQVNDAQILGAPAHRVNDTQILGAPAWINSEHYEIEAKREDSSADGQRKLSQDEEGQRLRLMIQSLLADRFKLTVHRETKELPIYVLTVAKNGSKLHASAPAADENIPLGPPTPNGPQANHSFRMSGRGELSVLAENLDRFADLLSHQLGRPVSNKTGLAGDYDFTLRWTPDEGRGQMPGGQPPDEAPPPEATGPSIFTALQEQLGLKLESQKGPVDTIVIDHVERPSEN